MGFYVATKCNCVMTEFWNYVAIEFGHGGGVMPRQGHNREFSWRDKVSECRNRFWSDTVLHRDKVGRARQRCSIATEISLSQ